MQGGDEEEMTANGARVEGNGINPGVYAPWTARDVLSLIEPAVQYAQLQVFAPDAQQMLADERHLDPGCRNTADEARRAEIMLEGEGSEFAVIIFIGCGGGIAVARPELGVDERRQAVILAA